MNSYQAHSSTSRAANFLVKKERQKDKVMELMGEWKNGLTGLQIAKLLNIPPGSASARLRELQLDGKIKKSFDVRDGGNVWKLAHLVPIEAERKRDKAGEALELIRSLLRTEYEHGVILALNRVMAVLK